MNKMKPTITTTIQWGWVKGTPPAKVAEAIQRDLERTLGGSFDVPIARQIKVGTGNLWVYPRIVTAFSRDQIVFTDPRFEEDDYS